MIIIWTQKELAECLGVSPEYIREIKTKRRKLSKKRQKLLRAFYQSKMLIMKWMIDEINQNLKE